jgi:hypothetical protein
MQDIWALKSLVCRGGQLHLTAPRAGKGQKVKKTCAYIYCTMHLVGCKDKKKQLDMSCIGGQHTSKVLHSKYNISFLC